MNFLDVDFPGVTEAYKGSLEDWLELFERYAFPRTSDTETSTEMKRIFKRYTEVTYEDWLDSVIKSVRDEIWYEDKINLSSRELYLVVRKYPRIEEKLKAIYHKFSISNNLLEQQYLQEATSSYIGILRDAYKDKDNKDLLTPTIAEVRQQYSDTHPFLVSQAFDPYFKYLTEIFERNGNSRYIPVGYLADVQKSLKQKSLKQTLDAHHIIFRSLGGTEKNVDNLIALFREEHIKAHELFIDCLRSYLEEPESNAEDKFNSILVKARKSLNILSRDNQDRVSVDILTDLLADDLEKKDRKAVINRINEINLTKLSLVVGRKNKVNSSNLQTKEKAQYKVSFTLNIKDILGDDPRIDPNDSKCAIVDGIAGVQEIILDVTGKQISKDSVQNRTTSKEKPIPLNKRGNKIPDDSFTEFDLQPGIGIYRVTGDGPRHESKPIIYFKVNRDTLTVDYSSGQWVQNPNVLNKRKIGLPDDAYSRLDQIQNDLVKGINPFRVFFGNTESKDKNQPRDCFIFMYAEDIDLLQNLINKENKENRAQQISIKVMKDDEIWYPKAK